MKALVAYQSMTGNTRKLAEAIYDEIACEKEIKKIGEVTSLAGYDVAFLGFPIHADGPDGKARGFLGRCAAGENVALFVTHGHPASSEAAASYVAKFKAAAAGATVLGCFNCQGQMPKLLKLAMRAAPDPEVRLGASKNDDVGQPDAAQLQRVRAFAREMVEKAIA